MISEELKVAIVEGVGSDFPKGDDSRVTVEIWDGRDWGDKGVKAEVSIGLIRMGILRCWKHRITQGCCKFLRRISSACRGLTKSGGAHVIESWYGWDEDTHRQYL